MRTAKLGEICDITMGQSPPGETYNSVGNGLPLVGGASDFGELYPATTRFTNAPVRVCQKDDILICIRATIGTKNLADRPYCLGRGVAALRPDPSALDDRFLWHYLDSASAHLQRIARGATFKQVTGEDVAAVSVPLPPLSEQRRVAAVLDRVEGVRGTAAGANALALRLPRAIYQSMFGQGGRLSAGMRILPLTELCATSEAIRCGPFGTQLNRSLFRTSGVPLWGIRQVNAAFSIETTEFLDPETAERLKQYSLLPGDVVMTRKGTIGNCAVYPEYFSMGIMHSDLLRIRVDRRLCDPTFLSHQLHYSPEVARQVAQISSGAIMAGINVSKLKGIKVQVPDLGAQQEFAARMGLVGATSAKLEGRAVELGRMAGALSAHAFRGPPEVTPQSHRP